jgi:uncharacterized delta-60 repeat protein
MPGLEDALITGKAPGHVLAAKRMRRIVTFVLRRPAARWANATSVAVASLILALTAGVASAASGDLDLTFHGDGKTFANFTAGRDSAFDVAIHAADGSIVVVGAANALRADASFVIARFDDAGLLDPTFGGDGKVVTNLTGRWDGANAVAIQVDGKIVVAGEAGWAEGASDSKFALARYGTDGTLDDTFSGDGKVLTNLSPGPDFVFGIEVQVDGKIVVAGGAGGSGGRIALARYRPTGALDMAFGGDGLVTTNLSRFDDRADDLAIQADGKIVVAGTANYFSAQARFAVVRYDADGSRDGTFGGDGIATTNLTASFDGAFGLAIQPADSRIVVVGQAGGGDAGRLAAVRYGTDGSLDSSFSADGKVVVNFTTRLDYADDVVLQPDGKIVAGGAIRFYGPDPRFAVARFEEDGDLDTTFGGGGKVTTDFDAPLAGIYGLAIQPGDGKIVAVGTAGGAGGRFGIARYVP